MTSKDGWPLPPATRMHSLHPLHMFDGTERSEAAGNSNVCQGCVLWFGPGSPLRMMSYHTPSCSVTDPSL